MKLQSKVFSGSWRDTEKKNGRRKTNTGVKMGKHLMFPWVSPETRALFTIFFFILRNGYLKKQILEGNTCHTEGHWADIMERVCIAI